MGVRREHKHTGRLTGGFSLIEVIFAIAMLSVGIMGILSLFTTGIARATWAANMTTASMEAQSLVTRLMSETDGQARRIKWPSAFRGTDQGQGPPHVPDRVRPVHPGHLDANGKPSIKGGTKPVRLTPIANLFWVCRVKAVHSDYKPISTTTSCRSIKARQQSAKNLAAAPGP